MNVLISRGVAMSAPVLKVSVMDTVLHMKSRLYKAITEDVLISLCK